MYTQKMLKIKELAITGGYDWNHGLTKLKIHITKSENDHGVNLRL